MTQYALGGIRRTLSKIDRQVTPLSRTCVSARTPGDGTWSTRPSVGSEATHAPSREMAAAINPEAAPQRPWVGPPVVVIRHREWRLLATRACASAYAEPQPDAWKRGNWARPGRAAHRLLPFSGELGRVRHDLAHAPGLVGVTVRGLGNGEEERRPDLEAGRRLANADLWGQTACSCGPRTRLWAGSGGCPRTAP